MKHILIGVLFFTFSAFTGVQPAEDFKKEIPSVEVLKGEIEEKLSSKNNNPIPKKKKEKVIKTNVIVDDVMVMLHDKPAGGLAMMQYQQTEPKTPFPG